MVKVIQRKILLLLSHLNLSHSIAPLSSQCFAPFTSLLNLNNCLIGQAATATILRLAMSSLPLPMKLMMLLSPNNNERAPASTWIQMSMY